MKKFESKSSIEQSIQEFTLGQWKVKSLPYEVLISNSENKQMVDIATAWSSCFNPNHKNWITERFNVPSSLIRFDYVVDSTGIIHVFEVEDRPAGIEINALNNTKMFDLFVDSIKSYLSFSQKKFGLFISSGRVLNSDDIFWFKRIKDEIDCRIVVGSHPSNQDDSIWMIRSLREENEYFNLSPHSLSTIEYEGDKSYGVALGLWDEIGPNLPWDKPFVLKPDAGCRCENVHLYHPKKPGGGYSTKTKIEKAVVGKKVKYLQDYHSPEFPSFLPNGYAMIRRCYLSFNIVTNLYEVIGGQWEARPDCHKVHGASDSICGPLIV